MWEIQINSEIVSFVYIADELRGMTKDVSLWSVEEGDVAVTLISASNDKLVYETVCSVRKNNEYVYPKITVNRSQFIDYSRGATKEEICNGVTDDCGVVYSKNGKQLLRGWNVSTSPYQVKAGCLIIRPYAFIEGDENYINECKTLKEISLPNSIRYIGRSAFSSCINLEKIENINGITSIEPDVFCGCVNLKSITLPFKLRYIGENAFAGCNNMKSLEFPPNLEEIDDCAFEGCSSLTEIKIPKDVIRVGANAFMDCDGINKVVFEGNVVNIGSNAFRNCINLHTVIFLGIVSHINNDAFGGEETNPKFYVPDGRIDLFNAISKSVSFVNMLSDGKVNEYNGGSQKSKTTNSVDPNFQKRFRVIKIICVVLFWAFVLYGVYAGIKAESKL